MWLDDCALHQRTTSPSLQTTNLLSFVAVEPHCHYHDVPWGLNTCSTQRSPVHRVLMHGASNRDTHLHPLYDNSLVYLTITTYVRRSRRVTSGVRVGEQPYKTLRFFSPTPTPNYSELPSQEEPGSNLTASALVSEVSAIACTSGVWPPLRSVSVVQKNKLSTMVSSNVQSIELLMDCTARRFWMMRQSNRCSTPAPRSSWT